MLAFSFLLCFYWQKASLIFIFFQLNAGDRRRPQRRRDFTTHYTEQTVLGPGEDRGAMVSRMEDPSQIPSVPCSCLTGHVQSISRCCPPVSPWAQAWHTAILQDLLALARVGPISSPRTLSPCVQSAGVNKHAQPNPRAARGK